MDNWDVIVVGAGAAGLVASQRAADQAKRTLVLEKNTQTGIKILMSGGTRCNLTQSTDARGIVAAFGKPGRFLHSALARLGPRELVALVEAAGVATKVEATGKIFPVSNKARDVRDAFLRMAHAAGALFSLGEAVVDVERDETGFRIHTSTRTLATPRLILTTGGCSYPGSGTTGDGYAWARRLGHHVENPRPSLVPLRVDAPWVADLKGVTLDQAKAAIKVNPLNPGAASGTEPKAKGPAKGSNKPLAEAVGGLLLAHFGLSGPSILDVSRAVSGHPRPSELVVELDLAIDWSEERLEQHFRDEAAAGNRAHIASLLPLPHRLAAQLVTLCQISDAQRIAELSKDRRRQLIGMIKRLTLPVKGTLGFGKAEVTAGGVALGEVDSRTMESRLVPGLFFAGEILDLDGPIGGYNFQAAFSTGMLAGDSVVQ